MLKDIVKADQIKDATLFFKMIKNIGKNDFFRNILSTKIHLLAGHINAGKIHIPFLPEEIQELSGAAALGPVNAYEMPRRNFYFGRWLKHGGKYPDIQLRFFRKGRAKFLPLPVHEKLEVEGPSGRLLNPLLHYPYRSARDIPRKLGFYAEALSENYLRTGRDPLFIFTRPFTRFISVYLLKLGFLDGAPGFKTALLDFLVIFISILRFREKTARR